jgi:hypothetical protein
VDEPGEMPHLRAISEAVDAMVEVRERSAEVGRRRAIAEALACAFGSVGGVFVEPPQHWDRLRWFVPCGLGSARALARLYADGGRACEYFYRPFANPVEEVSWRTGARILSAPETPPETALGEALAAVYGVTGGDQDTLADWVTRGEAAATHAARGYPAPARASPWATAPSRWSLSSGRRTPPRKPSSAQKRRLCPLRWGKPSSAQKRRLCPLRLARGRRSTSATGWTRRACRRMPATWRG